VEQLLAQTRALGYGVRAPDFGGHYNLPRAQWNDERESFAVPIWVAGEVIAVLNLTWKHAVATLPQMLTACLPPLRAAADEISAVLAETSQRR
jgi:IclR family mhp operon transcriptional activator